MDAHKFICLKYEILEDHINCSICLSAIRGAILTPCGHRYCNRCITEWVGRNHSCPCCNSSLNTGQFYFDVQFDALVDAVLTERDKSEQAYFDKMFNELGTNETGSKNETGNVFGDILKKHLKSSMLSHQKYFAKLKEDYERKICRLSMGLPQSEEAEEILSPGQTIDEMKTTLSKQVQESEKLAADAFDRYLTEHLPSLELIPVSVSVYIADKDIRIHNVLIKPTDKLHVIQSVVETELRNRCDDLISWNEEGGTCLLIGPLVKSDKYNIENVKKLVGQKHDIHNLSWESRPILQFSMRPGSEILLLNTLRTQSDLPKMCFVNAYDKSGTQSCDYYLCQQCSIKWICKSCIQCCHSGHNVTPFVLQHKPTWACCYCPKKKTCKIQNTVRTSGQDT